jgi:hypothetical protein
MIRRPTGNDWFLTTQFDHATFSGEIASHFGNATFDPLSPREPVLQAIALHDAGWPLHDDAPMLNSSGQPLHVFEMPMSEAVKIWSASTDRATERGGDYCGLLVSLHQLALSAVAMKRDAASHERATGPRGQFELNKFQQKQIERQEQLRNRLGLRTDLPLTLGLAPPRVSEAEDLLRRNFRLLTLADRLSLQLCCGKMLFPQIDGILPRAGGEPIDITTRFIADNELVIDPWPFSEKRLTTPVPARRLPAAPFPDVKTFRDAYRAAPAERVVYTLRSM